MEGEGNKLLFQGARGLGAAVGWEGGQVVRAQSVNKDLK